MALCVGGDAPRWCASGRSTRFTPEWQPRNKVTVTPGVGVDWDRRGAGQRGICGSPAPRRIRSRKPERVIPSTSTAASGKKERPQLPVVRRGFQLRRRRGTAPAACSSRPSTTVAARGPTMANLVFVAPAWPATCGRSTKASVASATQRIKDQGASRLFSDRASCHVRGPPVPGEDGGVCLHVGRAHPPHCPRRDGTGEGIGCGSTGGSRSPWWVDDCRAGGGKPTRAGLRNRLQTREREGLWAVASEFMKAKGLPNSARPIRLEIRCELNRGLLGVQPAAGEAAFTPECGRQGEGSSDRTPPPWSLSTDTGLRNAPREAQQRVFDETWQCAPGAVAKV